MQVICGLICVFLCTRDTAERFFGNLLTPSFFEVFGTGQHERQDG